MEEKILNLLREENRAFSIEELEEYLGVSDAEGLKELLKTLNKLEDELKIYHTKKDNFMLFNNSHLKIGKMIANKKGFGFVDIEGDEDVFVAQANMNNAIHGDQVIVEITSRKGLALEGRIVKIIDRKLKQMVGEFYLEHGVGKIKLDDDKVKLFLEVDKKHTLGAVPGHKVLVKVTNKLKDNHYKAEVIKILGHKNDPGVDILSIASKFEIADAFSDEVLASLDEIPSEVSEADLKGRRDLRDKEIFTIDGDDTKDIDDAISLEILDNGNYLLGVHIADVSYYVKENSPLDSDAYERGTSVYLADRVIPMLPHKLSNGICSLNPLVDRLAITCEMEIDDKGNTVNYDIYESVIRSRKQMTYKNVNLILEKNEIPAGYEEFVPTLKNMQELANILRNMRTARGSIDFDLDEAKIIVDEEGKAIDVKLRTRGVGEKLIEDFMIAANETVATHIYFLDLPFIYRVHGKPSEEKIDSFLKFLKVLGYQINIPTKEIHPRTMQKILDELKDKKEFHILSSMLLRSMQKAIYDKNNIGHFGIASKCYTHFTSPIRRYPDTTVHRLLRTYIFENHIDKDTINYWNNKLTFVAEHSSLKERNAAECEREVDDMKMAEYMMDHIGEKFTGVISGVMSFGLFIELPNLIEGLVRIDDLKDDYYTYDETTFALIGQRNGKSYRLGDKVNVILKAASKEAKTIDFEIDDEKTA